MTVICVPPVILLVKETTLVDPALVKVSPIKTFVLLFTNTFFSYSNETERMALKLALKEVVPRLVSN